MVRGTMRVPHLSHRKANLAALLSKLVLLQEARRAQSTVRAMLGAEDFLRAAREGNEAQIAAALHPR